MGLCVVCQLLSLGLKQSWGVIWARPRLWGRFWGWVFQKRETERWLIVTFELDYFYMPGGGGYVRERGSPGHVCGWLSVVFGNHYHQSALGFGFNMLGLDFHSYGFHGSAFPACRPPSFHLPTNSFIMGLVFGCRSVLLGGREGNSGAGGEHPPKVRPGRKKKTRFHF